jgi:hypothetical protein
MFLGKPGKYCHGGIYVLIQLQLQDTWERMNELYDLYFHYIKKYVWFTGLLWNNTFKENIKNYR